ncbi:unnamed protein product [Macrosiphum euphorbiae]|uniref:Uncharacterized protein n=1 Tax=Macrosiphum euphorbiae TaxID=13131 RepID=A0AAV0Y688_9HEMI|nr:unnamed protein product [Macrosiphum euphorbiae]
MHVPYHAQSGQFVERVVYSRDVLTSLRPVQVSNSLQILSFFVNGPSPAVRKRLHAFAGNGAISLKRGTRNMASSASGGGTGTLLDRLFTPFSSTWALIVMFTFAFVLITSIIAIILIWVYCANYMQLYRSKIGKRNANVHNDPLKYSDAFLLFRYLNSS